MTTAVEAAPFIGGALLVSGAGVWASRRAELIRRWSSWVLIALVVGGAFALGAPAVAVLASVLAAAAMAEYARAAGLRLPEALVAGAAGSAPQPLAWLAPELLWPVLAAGALAALGRAAGR